MGFRKTSGEGHRDLDARLAALAILGAIVAALAFAPTASASSHNPTGEFEPFAECPLNNVDVTDCVHFSTTGGSLTIGAKTIPIANAITLQGGAYDDGSGVQFVAAENGATLSNTPQPVPGGLFGIVAPNWWPLFVQEWFNNLINEGYTGINATVELAGPASSIVFSLDNLINQSGTALGLPVKIKLENAILGSNCYIGSNAAPISLALTTGTSGALSGAVGSLSFNGAFTLVTVSGTELVDGVFAAPAASGCGGIYSFLVNPLVNSIFGIPSASGHNAAILEGVLQAANAAAVVAADM